MTQEVESELDGVLAKIVVPEGDVEVGATVGVIEDGRRPVGERRRHAGGAPAGAAEPTTDGRAGAPAGARAQEDGAPGGRAAASPHGDRRGSRRRRCPAHRPGARGGAARSRGPAPRAGSSQRTWRGSRRRDRSAAGRPAAPAPLRPGEVEVVPLYLDPQDDRAAPHRGGAAPVFQLGVSADMTEAARAPRAARRPPRRGRREADRERRARQARGSRAHAAHPGQRDVQRRGDPATPERARRDRRRRSAGARRPGDPERRPPDGAGDRPRPGRPRHARAGQQAHPSGHGGRDVHDLEPRDVRRRAVHRRAEPAAGRDPRRRRREGRAGRRATASWTSPRSSG